MTQHIALYGKSSVGKTTLVANIGAALLETGFTVKSGGWGGDIAAGALPDTQR